MRVSPDPTPIAARPADFPLAAGKNGKTPEEAAKQFEEVLVREFVRTMTKDMFSSSLAGEDGAGWVKAQGEAQSDVLADAVTKHLVDSGTLGVADILLQGWKTQTASDQTPIGGPMPINPEPSLTTDAFLRLREALPIGDTDK